MFKCLHIVGIFVLVQFSSFQNIGFILNIVFGSIPSSIYKPTYYKCIPVLLYGLQELQLNKSQISSIDFVINRFFMKMFNTNNIEIVKCC